MTKESKKKFYEVVVCAELNDLIKIGFKNRAAALAELDKPEGGKHEFRHIDATPDAGYVRRILTTYIDDSYFSDNTAGLPPENELCIMMNKNREERNALLQTALSKLDKPDEAEKMALECYLRGQDIGKQSDAAVLDNKEDKP